VLHTCKTPVTIAFYSRNPRRDSRYLTSRWWEHKPSRATTFSPNGQISEYATVSAAAG